MPSQLEISMPATRSALVESLERISDFGAATSLPEEVRARLAIIVEELVLNLITHGYGQESTRPFQLRIERASSRLRVVYADEAPAFDPGAWLADHPPDRAIAESRVGGAGVALIFGLAENVKHEALSPGNRLTVTLTVD